MPAERSQVREAFGAAIEALSDAELEQLARVVAADGKGWNRAARELLKSFLLGVEFVNRLKASQAALAIEDAASLATHLPTLNVSKYLAGAAVATVLSEKDPAPSDDSGPPKTRRRRRATSENS